MVQTQSDVTNKIQLRLKGEKVTEVNKQSLPKYEL
jgi:hypothetical protein